MNTMKFHPILFSTEMVQAILEGRKTQTRRIVKGMALDFLAKDGFTPEYVSHPDNDLCPYGKEGDVLWVRETWCYLVNENGYTDWDKFLYKADNPDVRCLDADGFQVYNKNGKEASPWSPSIHMPKAACRIFLQIKSIGVERLHDISEADAIEEGITLENLSGDWDHPPTSEFQNLWKIINGEESWDANPWVWVIEFERIEKPENFC